MRLFLVCGTRPKYVGMLHERLVFQRKCASILDPMLQRSRRSRGARHGSGQHGEDDLCCPGTLSGDARTLRVILGSFGSSTHTYRIVFLRLLLVCATPPKCIRVLHKLVVFSCRCASILDPMLRRGPFAGRRTTLSRQNGEEKTHCAGTLWMCCVKRAFHV